MKVKKGKGKRKGKEKGKEQSVASSLGWIERIPRSKNIFSITI